METMVSTLWTRLRKRWNPAGRAPHFITLQHLMPADADLVAVQAALDRVGEALAVQFELQESAGDILLMDAALASRMSPQALQSFTAARPLVTLVDERSRDELMLSAAQRLERRQRELLVQLREIPLVRRRARPGACAAASTAQQASDSQAFDSAFDSRADGTDLLSADIDPAQHTLMQRVLHGLRAAEAPLFTASYGPDAHLRFDFLHRTVRIDALALQHLRVQREVPRPAPGVTPNSDAQVRELEEVVWDLGLACGPFALLDQPDDAWRTPLRWTRHAPIEQFTRVPRYIEMARLLQAAPMSPSELRRRARVGVLDMRRFLQAALMSQLLRWQSTGPATTAP